MAPMVAMTAEWRLRLEIAGKNFNSCYLAYNNLRIVVIRRVGNEKCDDIYYRISMKLIDEAGLNTSYCIWRDCHKLS